MRLRYNNYSYTLNRGLHALSNCNRRQFITHTMIMKFDKQIRNKFNLNLLFSGYCVDTLGNYFYKITLMYYNNKPFNLPFEPYVTYSSIISMPNIEEIFQ